MDEGQGTVEADFFGPSPQPVAGEQHLFEPPPELAKVYDPMIIRGDVEVRLDFEADIAALVREFPDELAAVEMRGYEEWERASVFLHEYVSEMLDVFLGGSVHLKDITVFGDPEIDFTWTQAMAQELAQKLAGYVPAPVTESDEV